MLATCITIDGCGNNLLQIGPIVVLVLVSSRLLLTQGQCGEAEEAGSAGRWIWLEALRCASSATCYRPR